MLSQPQFVVRQLAWCLQVEGQSDGEGNDSGGANGTWSNHDLRWSSQRRTRPPAPARKRDREPEAEDTDM